MTLSSFLWVGLGGMIGSCIRYGVSILMKSSSLSERFPIATLSVNTFGCLMIGVLAGYLTEQGESGSSVMRLFWMVGVLGGFTTFSAFGLETQTLITSGRVLIALLNVLMSVGLGLLAVVLGLNLGSRFS